MYLGARSLGAALRGNERSTPTGTGRQGLAAEAGFRQGLQSNLGNPKMAIFFSSLLPQFVPAAEGAFAAMLGLGLVFAGFTLAWLCAYAAVVDRAGGVLRRPRFQRAFDALTGMALIVFGARLATQER